MKKVKLALLASIMALAILLPLNAAVAAQPQLASDITPQLKLALAIKAPDIAGVGLPVTITVVEKYTGKPVPKAGVWAVDVKDIENGTSDAEDYASLAEEYGQFLGWTNKDGNVSHRFKEAGQYVLVAVKKGFIPGFAMITVKPLKALAIKAPGVAGVGLPVTITVVEK
ncbi:MAG: hypothetical protein JW732_03095, partial [Dehalococcoidia bacterium]|nr:hypothetical protein [Dehalococcoidia bacterium]